MSRKLVITQLFGVAVERKEWTNRLVGFCLNDLSIVLLR